MSGLKALEFENQRDRAARLTIAELIRRGFYSMAFQPILHTGSKQRLGFEALLRGPSGTPLSNVHRLFHDKDFLSRELFLQLDLACIGSAIRSGRLLASRGLLFINVHGETLWHLTRNGSSFLDRIRELNLPANRIVFEVSESTEKAHARLVARSLQPFRKMGVQIALDDIGVRHLWLHHLLWLEPDFIKVDRAFVKRIDAFPKGQRLLAGLVTLSEHAGARLIVEGVSSESEWHTVQRLGVPLAQGFWLGCPETNEYYLHQDYGPSDSLPVPGFWKDAEDHKEIPWFLRRF
jgi:EAL domain-containing protein (putative c-di-GMP-specific phosphodiesterase class I)